jgi:hypothetical protein
LIGLQGLFDGEQAVIDATEVCAHVARSSRTSPRSSRNCLEDQLMVIT